MQELQNFLGEKCKFSKFVGTLAPLAPILTHPLFDVVWMLKITSFDVFSD